MVLDIVVGTKITHLFYPLLICVTMMYFLILLFYVDPASGLPYAINLCCVCVVLLLPLLSKQHCCYNQPDTVLHCLWSF